MLEVGDYVAHRGDRASLAQVIQVENRWNVYDSYVQLKWLVFPSRPDAQKTTRYVMRDSKLRKITGAELTLRLLTLDSV